YTNADIVVPQGPKDTCIYPNFAQEATAFQIDQGHVFYHRQGFNSLLTGLGTDQGPFIIISKSIQDPKWNIFFAQGNNVLGMQNISPKIGQFIGLPIRKLGSPLGLGPRTGIGVNIPSTWV